MNPETTTANVANAGTTGNASKVIRVAIIGFVLLVGVLAAVTFLSRPRPNISHSYAMPDSFSDAAVPFGQDTVLFVNSKGLATYNYISGSTKTISPSAAAGDMQTSDTLSVSPDQRYVLFHNMQAFAGGALAAKLQQLGMDTTSDYWWVYNVTSQSFQPLPGGILGAELHGDNIFTTTRDTAGVVLTTYDAGTLKQVSTLHITPGAKFYAVSGGILYEATDATIYFTTDGIVSRQLLAESNLVGVTSDNKWAFAIDNHGSTRQLKEINLQNFASTAIADQVVNAPVLSQVGPGAVLYAAGGGKTPGVYYFDIATQKTIQWTFTKTSPALNEPSIRPLMLLGTNAAVLQLGGHNYLVSGSNYPGTTPEN